MLTVDGLKLMLQQSRCTFCKHLVESKCTQENNVKHEKDKEALRLAYGRMYEDATATNTKGNASKVRTDMHDAWKATFENKNNELNNLYICLGDYEPKTELC